MNTGLRVGEVTGLTWDDVKTEDENNRMIDVNHNLVYYAEGGSTDIKNCQMLCKRHNRAKGNK